MNTVPTGSLFWWRWLVVVTFGVALFGLSMVLMPGLILQLFSLLYYSSSQHIGNFEQAAIAYVTLVHGVLGAVMFGWGVALLFVLFRSFRRGEREGWRIVTISLTAWFIPDTVFSLWSGFWQNAVLNLLFAMLFAIPLAATYKAYNNKGV